MKKILVPFDFSENATSALEYAIQLSKITDSELAVFHCLLPPFNLGMSEKTEEERDRQVREELELASRKLQNEVHGVYKNTGIAMPPATKIGVEVNPLVVEKIMEVAATQQADLLVMGTHGASGLKKVFFGSNTSNMVAKSSLPILAIPGSYRYKKIDSIALASDLDDVEVELEKVIPIAAALNARIDVVYLDFGLDPYERKENMAIRLVEKTAYPKIRFINQRATLEQTLLNQLRKYLDEQNPGWLVMFPGEHRFWDRFLLHSKTESMVNSLSLPLLSIRKRQMEA